MKFLRKVRVKQHFQTGRAMYKFGDTPRTKARWIWAGWNFEKRMRNMRGALMRMQGYADTQF